jgi:hypothetical protein
MLKERLTPINLLRGTVEKIATTTSLKDSILGTSVGVGAGFLIKKMVKGSSGNRIRGMIAMALQYGIINMASRNPAIIKNLGQHLIHSIFKKRSNAHPADQSQQHSN